MSAGNVQESCGAFLQVRISMASFAYENTVQFSQDFYETIIVGKFPSRDIRYAADNSPSFHPNVLITVSITA